MLSDGRVATEIVWVDTFSSINPLTPQQTVRFSFKDLLLLVYGMAGGQKPLYTRRVLIDMYFYARKLV